MEAAVVSNATSGVNTARTDALERFTAISPGTAVQPGTATLVSSGAGPALVVDLGRVPDARTFTDALRIRNTDTVAHTIDLGLLGAIPGVAALEFSDGTTSKSIGAGVTQQLRIRTTAASAGLQSGSLRLRETTTPAFYRRDLSITTRQAPSPPTAITAVSTPSPAPRIALAWTASSASGVAGYNVYRATAAAGPYAKINPSLVVGTTYDDTTAASGTRYWYQLRAVASGVAPELEGLDSTNANGRIPPTPTSVAVVVGASNPANYINFASRTNATVRVVVPAATTAGDTINLRLTDGTTTVNQTMAATGGAQTLDFTAVNATALGDGTVALSSWITRGAAETGSSFLGSAIKDTAATFTTARVAATAANPADFINRVTGISPGTATAGIDLPASSMATDTVDVRLTRGTSTTSVTGAGTAGAATQMLAGLSTNGWTDGAVTVEARIRDVAGNDSGWLPGTNATRDTVVPAAPTAAQIPAGATNPLNYVNFSTQGAAIVRVTSPATATDTVEARLTSGAATATAAAAGAAAANVAVNATALADTAVGGLGVSARVVDQAWNPSAWFTGTAGTKDTVMPNAPNFANIRFTESRFLWWILADAIAGNNAAIGAADQVKMTDYGANNAQYGWLTANASGNFGNTNLAVNGVPRLIGFDIRDTAWNTLARTCRNYTGTGTGAAATCP
ncbi:MAG: hypothetical protein JHC87_00035 [Thermoleophilaceae bacterium]|nr:hypothetical protein [Thermoleophilaceae bacterium]